ncbi:MAG: tetratricopeptide repeat protein, partial [Thermoplasmata archaeon]|nr:tetratricopeptide repeat protein [Thermoplasmata archaeon]
MGKRHGKGEGRGEREKEGENDRGNFEGLLNHFLSALDNSHALIILDDIHNANEGILNFMGALLKAMKKVKNAGFLITTRTMPDFYDRRLVVIEKRIAEFTLTGLSFDEAFDLMNTLMSSQVQRGIASLPAPGEPIEDDEIFSAPEFPFTKEEFERSYNETKGHPFALELLSSMRSPSARLDFERFLNEEIFEDLQNEERSVLMFSSVFRLPLNMKSLLEVIPDKDASRRHVELLIKKNLLREWNGMLSLHSLIEDLAESRLSREMSKLYHQAAVRYYAKLIERIEEQGIGEYVPGGTGEGNRGNEHHLIIEQIYHLIKADDQERAVRLIIEKADELISYGYGEFYDVLQLVDGNRIDERQREDMLEIMGDAHLEFGRLAEAFEIYQEKLEQAKEGSLEEARMLHKIGELEKERGDIDSSIEFKTKSLRIFQKKKNYGESARVYNELGLDLWKKNELENARNSFLKALGLLRKTGQKHALSRVLLNLAQFEAEEGDHEKAESYIKESLSTAASVREKIGIFHLSGDISLRKGEKTKALESYRKGFEIARKEKAFKEMMYFIDKIADLYIEQKRNAEALDVLSSGIDFIEEGSRRAEKRRIPFGSLQALTRKKKETGRTAPKRATTPALTKKQEELKQDNYSFAALCERAARLYQAGNKFEGAGTCYKKAA